MELLKALKAEYGGISQAQGEKLLKMVQDLVEDLSDEVMEALANGESEDEMGPMFGANIKFTPPSGNFYDSLDLSYLSNVMNEPAFNLGSSLSFKLDSLPKPSADTTVISNMIDTAWLEETLREAYPDQQVSKSITSRSLRLDLFSNSLWESLCLSSPRRSSTC